MLFWKSTIEQNALRGKYNIFVQRQISIKKKSINACKSKAYSINPVTVLNNNPDSHVSCSSLYILHGFKINM
jgi:hypothetical protein